MKSTSDEGMAGDSTNVRVSIDTRDRIAKLGSYDDTADKIIRRLLDFYEQEHEKKKR